MFIKSLKRSFGLCSPQLYWLKMWSSIHTTCTQHKRRGNSKLSKPVSSLPYLLQLQIMIHCDAVGQSVGVSSDCEKVKVKYNYLCLINTKRVKPVFICMLEKKHFLFIYIYLWRQLSVPLPLSVCLCLSFAVKMYILTSGVQEDGKPLMPKVSISWWSSQ